tara:strand:+ start:75 stop:1181 length:1107 start_codon:yes stop_codon:yes gene_type:complete
MSNPIRQHYIPKSYLKNFGTKGRKRTFLVDVYRINDKVELSGVSTSDICVQKNLYTIHTDEEKKKYALELFYAENVDSEYPNVYEILINPNIKHITPEQKYKILYVCLSLYFRTPTYLNYINRITDEAFDIASKTADVKSSLIKMNLFGEQLEFHLDELGGYKESYRIKNKKKFHLEHLEQWHKFIQYKYECNINVIKVEDKTAPIITCDNPVSIKGFKTTEFIGLFNSENVITLPLDENHFLEIHPNRMSDQSMIINRLEHDKDFVFTTNFITESNADDQLIGKLGSLKKHFAIQEEYNKEENRSKFVKKAKHRAEELMSLLQLVEKDGFPSVSVTSKLKEMNNDPHYKNDKQIDSMIKRVKDLGKW